MDMGNVATTIKKPVLSKVELGLLLEANGRKLARGASRDEIATAADRLHSLGLTSHVYFGGTTEIGHAVLRAELSANADADLATELANAKAELRAIQDQCAAREFALSKTEEQWPEVAAVAKGWEREATLMRRAAIAGWVAFVASFVGLIFG